VDVLLRIRYEVSLEDLIAFNLFHIRTSPTVGRARRWGLWGPPLLVMGAALAAALGGRRPEWMLGGVVFGALYMLVYPLGYRRRMERTIRSLVNEGRNDSVLCEHVLEITPDGLVDRTPVSETKAAWSIIERIEKTDTHTFVYTQAQGAHIIPRAALKDGDQEAFVAALEDRVPGVLVKHGRDGASPRRQWGQP